MKMDRNGSKRRGGQRGQALVEGALVLLSLLGTLRNGDQRVRVRVSNINAVMFVPYMSNVYRFPALTLEMPAQSLGATN